MIKLGIIGAMDVEVARLKEKLEDARSIRVSGMEFLEGKLAGTAVVLARCGVGKVHAAMCAQTLCDRFAVTHLVNTGIAGSLDARLDIGDVVISTDVMQHDFDCVQFGYSICRIPGLSVTAFPADEALAQLAFDASEALRPGHTRRGRVATGDQFVARQELKDQIISRTQALCTEMEGGAIAQVAHVNAVPFVILRAISDKADHSAEMDYPTFEHLAAEHCAAVTLALAAKLE